MFSFPFAAAIPPSFVAPAFLSVNPFPIQNGQRIGFYFPSKEHLLAFYKTFKDVKHNHYDGMIITGAPVEKLEFEEVEYWDELCEIMEWTLNMAAEYDRE